MEDWTLGAPRILMALLLVGGAVVCGLAVLSAARDQRIADRNALIEESGAREPSQRDDLSSRKPESKSEANLRAAGLEISPLVWVALRGALAILAFAIASAFLGIPAIGAACAILALVATSLFVKIRAKERRLLLEEQFGRACSQIGGSVRTGLSVERAIRSAAVYVDDPLREELSRVAAETRHEPDVAAALRRMADRTGNRDVAFLASQVDLNQRYGGRLADSISRLSETVTTRQEMRRLIRSESASGKTGAKAVVGLTVFLIVFMFASNPSYLEFYTTQPIGWIVAGISAVLLGFGCFRLYRCTDIKMD